MGTSHSIHPLAISIAMALGTLGAPTRSAADVVEMTWQGWFTMFNRFGDTLMNSSINQKVSNQYMTPISGTLTYDTQESAGTLSMVPFDFMGNPSNEPFTVNGANFELIGDGFGGPGSLMLGNMMYDWNYNRDVSFSIVWDMGGMLQGLANGNISITGIGSIPSVDGTYASYNGGTFLNFGASPIATTTFNTTNVPGCKNLDCIGYNPSGMLPILGDTELNTNKSYYSTENVYGIGGSPIQDSGFQFKNLNFDITAMQVIAINGVPTVIPVPDGDLDLDGVVNAGDIVLAQRIAFGLTTASTEQLIHGDVAPLNAGSPDPDGFINTADVLLLEGKALGIVSFP